MERYDSRGVPLSQKSQELEQRAKVKTEMNYTIDQVIAQLKSNNRKNDFVVVRFILVSTVFVF